MIALALAALLSGETAPIGGKLPFARGPVRAIQELARSVSRCGMEVRSLTIRPNGTADLYWNINSNSKYKQVDCVMRKVQDLQKRGANLDLFFVGNAAVKPDSK